MNTDLKETMNNRMLSAPSSAADQIINFIKQNAFKPKDKLPSENQLVVLLGFSRSSIREALSGLEALGLIERRKGQGTFFKEVDLERWIANGYFSLSFLQHRWEEVQFARKLLECEVAALAAMQKNEEAWKPVKEIVEEMKALLLEEKLDSDKVYNLTWAFHTALSVAARNTVIHQILMMLRSMIKEAQLKFYWIDIDLDKELRNHIDLFWKIRSGDPIAARSAMYIHLHDVDQAAENNIKKMKLLD